MAGVKSQESEFGINKAQINIIEKRNLKNGKKKGTHFSRFNRMAESTSVCSFSISFHPSVSPRKKYLGLRHNLDELPSPFLQTLWRVLKEEVNGINFDL